MTIDYREEYLPGDDYGEIFEVWAYLGKSECFELGFASFLLFMT